MDISEEHKDKGFNVLDEVVDNYADDDPDEGPDDLITGAAVMAGLDCLVS